MKKIVIEINKLSKMYWLGKINSGTISRDLSTLWARALNKIDPNSKINLNTINNDPHSNDKVWALKNINLKIQKGDIIGVIGKNGAGKSTLLKVLSRITSPTEGEAKIYGKVASLLEVGTGFHPELTGRENIYLNGAILGMDKKHIDNKLNEIIKFSGIKKYIDTPIKRYSTGMTVRLGFSIAAYLDADILFVDEVLAVGDAEFREKALNKMSDLSKNQKKTIIFISHNLNAMLSLTKRCILIENGKIVMQGETKKVIESYLNKDKPNSATDFPKNDRIIEIENISLENQNGEKKNAFFYKEDIIIKYNYQLKKDCRNLRVAFNISDSLGSIIFNTADYNNGKRPANLSSKGKYTAKATIPKYYFNEGKFIIGITADIPFKKICLNMKNLLAFSVSFDSLETSDLNERYEGSLFPKIIWETYKK